MYNIFNDISIILSVLFIVWSIFILIKKNNLREAKYFSSFVFFIGMWTLSLSISNYLRNIEGVIFWTRICYLFGLMVLLFFYFFIYIFRFPQDNIFKKSKIIIIISLVLLLGNFIIPDNFVYSDVVINQDKPAEGILGNFYFSFSFLFLYLLAKSLYVLLKGFKKLSYKKKSQILYVTSGGIISILSAFLFTIILPYLGNEDYYSIASISFVFFIGLTSYAIVKHQLLDIKIVIQRGVVYSFLLAILIGIYLFFIFVLGFLFQQTTDFTIFLSAAIAVIIGSFSVHPLEKIFRKITDKFFFKDKYDFSDAIFQISESLNKNIDLEALIKQLSGKLREIIKIKQIKIILSNQNIIYDKEGGYRSLNEDLSKNIIEFFENSGSPLLVSDEIEDIKEKIKKSNVRKKYLQALEEIEYLNKKYKVKLIVAILLENKLVGIITLGDKLSGEEYSQDDFKLFKTLSYQAGVAIEKAQLFKQVKMYSITLEEKVKQRTAKLKGIQEEQKKIMLEVSHGLQTPLTVIKGELETLKDQYPDNKNLKMFEKAVDRISKFIYDMLKLSRLEIEGRDFKKEKFNLSELLEELYEDFLIITKEKNINVIKKIEKNIKILGDKGEIEELIMNLVSNSVKYMGDEEKKGNKIILSLKKEKKNIVLSVEDTGIGIKKEHISRLFNRFYRIKDSKCFNEKGTGLGLAICKKIVDRHSGTIKVVSEPDKGTKFIINLSC